MIEIEGFNHWTQAEKEQRDAQGIPNRLHICPTCRERGKTFWVSAHCGPGHIKALFNYGARAHSAARKISQSLSNRLAGALGRLRAELDEKATAAEALRRVRDEVPGNYTANNVENVARDVGVRLVSPNGAEPKSQAEQTTAIYKMLKAICVCMKINV